MQKLDTILFYLEVTNVNKIEIPSVQETEEDIQPSQSLDSIDYNIQLGDIDYSNSQSEDTTDLSDQSEDSSDSTLIGEIITGRPGFHFMFYKRK